MLSSLANTMKMIVKLARIDGKRLDSGRAGGKWSK
jgi:hypothetical protein